LTPTITLVEAEAVVLPTVAVRTPLLLWVLPTDSVVLPLAPVPVVLLAVMVLVAELPTLSARIFCGAPAVPPTVMLEPTMPYAALVATAEGLPLVPEPLVTLALTVADAVALAVTVPCITPS
jgi:hypothetical protein